jgi:hypothetical protein
VPEAHPASCAALNQCFSLRCDLLEREFRRHRVFFDHFFPIPSFFLARLALTPVPSISPLLTQEHSSPQCFPPPASLFGCFSRAPFFPVPVCPLDAQCKTLQVTSPQRAGPGLSSLGCIPILFFPWILGSSVHLGAVHQLSNPGFWPLRRPPGSPHSCCHMAFPKPYFSPPLFPHPFFALHFGGSPSTQAESIGRSCGHRTWYCASLPLPPSPMAGPLCGARVD